MLPHVLSHGVFLSTLALLTGNVQLVQYLIEVQNADINAIDQVTYLLVLMSHIKSPSESICVVWLVAGRIRGRHSCGIFGSLQHWSVYDSCT